MPIKPEPYTFGASSHNTPLKPMPNIFSASARDAPYERVPNGFPTTTTNTPFQSMPNIFGAGTSSGPSGSTAMLLAGVEPEVMDTSGSQAPVVPVFSWIARYLSTIGTAFKVNAQALDPNQHDPFSSVSQGVQAEVTNVAAELSFCVPTSLAFFKRLTWEQSPWVMHFFDAKAVNPMSAVDAQTIEQHLGGRLGAHVSSEAIQNGLFFGSAYPSFDATGDIGMYPHIFVIFPYAKTCVATDERFLRIWHNEIVQPAFDCAWLESGLAITYSAGYGGNTALPSDCALMRIRAGEPECVRVKWPEVPEQDDRCACVFNDAWETIKSSLKYHPDLSEFQDPILLAVSRGEQNFAGQTGTNDMYTDVAREWKKYIDDRYVDQWSFKVVLQSILEARSGVEVKKEEEEEVRYEDFMIDWTNYAGSDYGPLNRPALQDKRKGNGSGVGNRKKPRRA
jgi:hypothetical protein